jgi:hypothetical protein
LLISSEHFFFRIPGSLSFLHEHSFEGAAKDQKLQLIKFLDRTHDLIQQGENQGIRHVRQIGQVELSDRDELMDRHFFKGVQRLCVAVLGQREQFLHEFTSFIVSAIRDRLHN